MLLSRSGCGVLLPVWVLFWISSHARTGASINRPVTCPLARTSDGPCVSSIQFRGKVAQSIRLSFGVELIADPVCSIDEAFNGSSKEAPPMGCCHGMQARPPCR